MNAQLGPESMSIPTESLGTMLDMTTDFDWVSACRCVVLRRENNPHFQNGLEAWV
jgi:hypothetical protein